MSERLLRGARCGQPRRSAAEYPNGIRVQEIELVFTRRSRSPILARAGAGGLRDQRDQSARELAFELLMLAEVAEQWEQAR